MKLFKLVILLVVFFSSVSYASAKTCYIYPSRQGTMYGDSYNCGHNWSYNNYLSDNHDGPCVRGLDSSGWCYVDWAEEFWVQFDLDDCDPAYTATQIMAAKTDADLFWKIDSNNGYEELNRLWVTKHDNPSMGYPHQADSEWDAGNSLINYQETADVDSLLDGWLTNDYSDKIAFMWAPKEYSTSSSCPGTWQTDYSTAPSDYYLKITYTPPCGNGICGSGETYSNCPQDCCKYDCTATYDSTCHSACDAYCGIVDSQCNGDALNSCGDKTGDCYGCDYQSCSSGDYCPSSSCADCNTQCNNNCQSYACYGPDPDCDPYGNLQVCCGDGACEGSETCDSCPGDCGSCPTCDYDSVCDAGETYSNCPNDCCQSNCTSTTDSICHSECDAYCGIVDSQCNGNALNSCGNSEGDCIGCDYQSCSGCLECSGGSCSVDDDTECSNTEASCDCSGGVCSTCNAGNYCSSYACFSCPSTCNGVCSDASCYGKDPDCNSAGGTSGNCGDGICCGETAASCPWDCAPNTADLAVVDVIPIQVIPYVDMVKGKSGFVRVVVYNYGPAAASGNVTAYFNGNKLTYADGDGDAIKPIPALTNVTFDFKCTFPTAGTNLVVNASVVII